MLFKSIILLYLVQFIIAQNEQSQVPVESQGLSVVRVKVPLDMASQHKILQDCETEVCGSYKMSSNTNSEYFACQTGCNNYFTTGANCEDGCSNNKYGNKFEGEQFNACMTGCKNAVDDAPTNVVDPKVIIPVPKAPPKVEDDKDEVGVPTSLLNDAIDTINKDKQASNNGLTDLLNHGIPSGNGIPLLPMHDDDSDEKDNDSDSNENSSEEKSDGQPIDDKSLDEPASFFNILNQIYGQVSNKINDAIQNGKGYIYYARVYDNGTIIEKHIEKPLGGEMSIDSDSGFDSSNDLDEAGRKFLNALFGKDDKQMPEKVEVANEDRPINWKGIPLPIGKPIIERLDENHRDREFYRQCRPLSFHFKTLCHDLNNFFVCAAMRTGLPRWFFLSLILLCSFFLIWLGIFILSMIRKMRKQERVIFYEEDQLPLYKDIIIDEKLPPAYIEAEALPEKVKLETV